MGKILTAFIIGILLLLLQGCNFNTLSAGSYPFAQKYEFNYPEIELIEAIRQFKKENPQYNVLDSSYLKDGQNDHWYDIYFFYPEEKEKLNTWTRAVNDSVTNFAFVAVYDGLRSNKWKEINHEFSRKENEKHKRKFEERIVKKVLEICQRSR